jgi:hypothetical protein
MQTKTCQNYSKIPIQYSRLARSSSRGYGLVTGRPTYSGYTKVIVLNHEDVITDWTVPLVPQEHSRRTTSAFEAFSNY